MAKPRHKADTKQFMEMDYAEQAKSITAQINVLSKAIKHHVARSRKQNETRKKCLLQIQRMLGRLIEDL